MAFALTCEIAYVLGTFIACPYSDPIRLNIEGCCYSLTVKDEG
jgi:hypothetical protein